MLVLALCLVVKQWSRDVKRCQMIYADAEDKQQRLTPRPKAEMKY